MKTAWLVDDSEEVRYALGMMFRLVGYECRTFADAPSTAEALTAGETPDILFLDINMPGVSGLELLGFIRSRDIWVDLPILMLTAESAEASVEMAIRLGADGYVFKPVNVEELQLAIPIAIKRRHLAADSIKNHHPTDNEEGGS
jgi:DNA-binding response OmpR family regulator